jgi:Na+-translocating ferredoxin:NAD+ oxidoreductase subunit B
MNELARRIDDALPQTQCTRCGYPDCASYAQAMADGEAGINQCPPGGPKAWSPGRRSPAAPPCPLIRTTASKGPLTVAVIDEDWCIGCTLCIKACPTDAIVGTNKRMHTVIEPYCTGCELCIPVCPVDCISLEVVSGERTGWAAWSARQAASRQASRYEARKLRLVREKREHEERLEAKARPSWPIWRRTRCTPMPATLDRKRAVIEAALARAVHAAPPGG